MDEKRLILAAVLSLAVIAVWQVVFPPPVSVEEVREDKVAERAEEPRTESSPGPAVALDAESQPPLLAAREWGAAESVQELVVEGEGFRAVVSNRGGELVSYRLTDHLGSEGEPLEMVRERSGGPYPYAIVDRFGAPLVEDALFVVSRPSPERLELRWSGEQGWVEKDFVFGNSGLLDVTVRAALLGEPWRIWIGPGVRNPSSAEEGQQYQVKEALWRAAGRVERIVSRKVSGIEEIPRSGLEWVALDDTYFIAAFFADESLAEVSMVPTVRRERNGGVYFDALRGLEELRGTEKKAARELALVFGGQSEELQLRGFWGGKERRRLGEVGGRLEQAIDWGFFGFLSRPLHSGLLWIHARVVPNFGWAIVVMTILIKIVLLPLTHASHVSMQKMQELNPKAQAIRAKFRGKLRDKEGRFQLDNQRKMNEEMQALYKDAGVNPMGGCLPMLAQIPVFFAYFRLLPLAIELRMAPWIGWIDDLSAADPYFLLPIIMGVSQVIQMKLTPQAADPMQRRIMQLFPVVFTVFSLGFPSGLVLYWLTNNVFTIFQIAIYNRIRARGAAVPARQEKGHG